MRISYYLIDPTKNYTLLVETPVPPELQPEIASTLMEVEPLAEQVGFISEGGDNSINLRMAGGEFCGNAAMSAALVHTLSNPDCRDVAVRFSGVDICVAVKIADDNGNVRGTVEMPEPLAIERIALPLGAELPVVFFPGIAHVITEHPMEKSVAEELAPVWCGYLVAEAMGIMFFDREKSKLTPLVYVPSSDTMFWENSCASGTAALGYYLRFKKGGGIEAEITEPGGILKISAEDMGALRLTGSVSVVYKRDAEI